MKGAQLRIQLSEETVGRLDGIAGRLGGESRAFAALRLIEEGLRTEKHPLVYFTDGPAVRRARLLGGAAFSQ